MNRILFKRIPRELKANPVKFGALFFVIVLSIYLVCTFAIDYDTIIADTQRTSAEHAAEDGDFNVFIPLSTSQLSQLQGMGVELERQFYMDVDGAGTRTMRLFKVRQGINTLAITQGRLPKDGTEAVLEVRFAIDNGYALNSQVTISGCPFTVVGFGMVPDYGSATANLTDTFMDTSKFGLAFVDAAGYQDVKERTSVVEIYNYAFRLGPGVTFDALKKAINAMAFDYTMVDDVYYQQTIADATRQQQQVKDALSKLYQAAGELDGGLAKLDAGSAKLEAGTAALRDAGAALSNGLGTISDSFAKLSAKIDDSRAALAEMKDIDKKVNDLLASYSSDMFSITTSISNAYLNADLTLTPDTYATLLEAYRRPETASFIDGVEGLLNSIVAYRADIDSYIAGVDQLIDGISDVGTVTAKLSEGERLAKTTAAKISAKLDQLYAGISELSAGIAQAHKGSTTLQQSLGTLDSFIGEALERAKSSALSNLSLFVKQQDNPRMTSAVSRATAYRTVILLLGVVVLVMVSYILSVFVLQQLSQDIKNIGALYAMGVRKDELMRYYIALPVLLASVGTIIGLAVALLPMRIVDGYRMMAANFSLVDEPARVVQPYLVIGCVVMPMAITALVNVLAVNRYLSRTALSLLNNEQPKTGIVTLRAVERLPFVRMFQVRQLVREERTYKTVVAGVLNCIIVIMLGVCINYMGAYATGPVVDDVKYEYMYIYKYPDTVVPTGGEACYSRTLSFEMWGRSAGFTMIGIDGDNPYFPACPRGGGNRITISSAVAEKYLLGAGSRIILTDDASDRDYVFYVTDVCDYESGLCVFMDIGSMRELFDQEDGYYNMVLSKDQLSIPQGRLYSTVTRAQYLTAADQFTKQVGPLRAMVLGIGFINLALSMYILMGVVIDRSAYAVSLMKIFGFSRREIAKLFLDGNFFVVILGTALGLPVAVVLTKNMIRYSLLTFNLGMGYSVPWYVFIVLLAAIIATFLLVSAMLTRRTDRVPLAEALKSRG